MQGFIFHGSLCSMSNIDFLPMLGGELSISTMLFELFPLLYFIGAREKLSNCMQGY